MNCIQRAYDDDCDDGLKFDFCYDYAPRDEPAREEKRHIEKNFLREFSAVIDLAKNALQFDASSSAYEKYFGTDEYYDEVMGVIRRIGKAHKLNFTMPVTFQVRAHLFASAFRCRSKCMALIVSP